MKSTWATKRKTSSRRTTFDITAVEPRKRDACMAHVSQGPAKFYADYFAKMHVFRGMEGGFHHAEAFVHLDQSPSGRLPGG